MPDIVAHFTNGNVPLESPGNVPTIRIQRTDTGALVVTDSAMTELGDGSYRFTFAPVSTLEYSIRADGDPTASGQVTPGERYVFGALSGIEEAQLARLDADVSSRATQADILSDATPFQGADIAAILVDTDVTIPGLITGLNDLSSSEVFTAVWESVIGGFVGGSFGDLVNNILTDTDVTIPGLITGLNDPDVAAIADGVWDEVLTGATHNVTNSSGKRLRQLADRGVVADGTAQAGAASTITLAAGESALDGFFVDTMLVIIGGTGIGQVRAITAYDGTSKVATVHRAWETNPAADSDYAIGLLAATAVLSDGVPFQGADIAAILTDTDVTIPGLITGLNDLTALQVEDAVWDADKDDHGVANSFGLMLNAVFNDTSSDLPDLINTLPTALENADAVWDEVLAGHLGAGSTGFALDAAGSGADPAAIADAVWDELRAAHVISGSFGEFTGDAAMRGTDSANTVVPLAAATDQAEHDATQADIAALSIPTVPAIADGVWDEPRAGHVAAGSFGVFTGDAAMRGTDGANTTVPLAAAVDQAEHDQTQTDIAALNDLSADQAADAVWDELLTGVSHNVTNSAGKRVRQLNEATVALEANVVDVAPTAASFDTDLTEVDGFWEDTLLIFVAGSLTGQARTIAAYANASGNVTFDEPLTSAPANGDSFLLLADHIHPVGEIADGVWQELTAGNEGAGSFGEALTRLFGDLTRTKLFFAVGAISTGGRVVPAGAVSHMEVQVRTDAGSFPGTSYFVVFGYEPGDAATDQPRSSNTDSVAPTDGSFTSTGFPT